MKQILYTLLMQALGVGYAEAKLIWVLIEKYVHEATANGLKGQAARDFVHAGYKTDPQTIAVPDSLLNLGIEIAVALAKWGF